jgi:hypothetical protein
VSLEQKIELLAERGLHAILHRNAGWACQFYAGPYDDAGRPVREWQGYLCVHRFLPTLSESIDWELERLAQSPHPEDVVV